MVSPICKICSTATDFYKAGGILSAPSLSFSGKLGPANRKALIDLKPTFRNVLYFSTESNGAYRRTDGIHRDCRGIPEGKEKCCKLVF